MIDIQKIAEKAGFGDYAYEAATLFERFAALYREAVVQELLAGSALPCTHFGGDDDPDFSYYTPDQLAGALARERERCAQKVEADAVCDNAAYYAAAIRSGE